MGNKVELKLEDLEALYGLPIEVAARRLGVSRPTISRTLRRHGVKRWPYRKIRAMRRRRAREEAEKEGSERPDEDGPVEANVEEVNVEGVKIEESPLPAVEPPTQPWDRVPYGIVRVNKGLAKSNRRKLHPMQLPRPRSRSAPTSRSHSPSRSHILRATNRQFPLPQSPSKSRSSPVRAVRLRVSNLGDSPASPDHTRTAPNQAPRERTMDPISAPTYRLEASHRDAERSKESPSVQSEALFLALGPVLNFSVDDMEDYASGLDFDIGPVLNEEISGDTERYSEEDLLGWPTWEKRVFDGKVDEKPDFVSPPQLGIDYAPDESVCRKEQKLRRSESDSILCSKHDRAELVFRPP